MERKIVITIEDSFIDEDTRDFQTVEDFTALLLEASALQNFIEHEIGDVEILGIAVE